jgi:hypothetical protein
MKRLSQAFADPRCAASDENGVPVHLHGLFSHPIASMDLVSRCELQLPMTSPQPSYSQSHFFAQQILLDNPHAKNRQAFREEVDPMRLADAFEE